MNRLIKRISIFLVLSFSSVYGNAQSYNDLVSKAHSLYHLKDYSKSVKLFRKAFKVECINYLDQYAAACAASAAGKEDEALIWLRRAINYEHIGIAHTFRSEDFIPLRNSVIYKGLVERLERKIDSSKVTYDLSLKDELNAIHKEDQEIRKLYIQAEKEGKEAEKDSLGKLMQRLDSVNITKVCRILDTKGWVGKSVVGDHANFTLFLVIQHADLLTQQRYLPMAKRAVSVKNANRSELAYLEDRIAMREGGKQIYGSQMGMDPATLKYYVYPLFDPDNVNKRRREVGMQSLNEYLKYYDTTWDVEAYKKELPKLMKLNRMKGLYLPPYSISL